MKVVSKINKQKVDDQTIATIKDLLSKAESGELTSLVFVDAYKNGDVGHAWAGRPSIQMMGELENLKFNFFSQMYFPVVGE